MREIKFRAWDKVNGCWINIDSIVLCDDNSMAYLVPEEDNMPPCRENEVELMQSTGLKDIKGVEFYEGDIVEYTGADPYEDPSCYSIVEYDNGQFVAFDEPLVRCAIAVKIIDNKFENPKLLEFMKEG